MISYFDEGGCDMKRELTHEEEIKKMAEYGAALASDTKKSEKFLIRSGIYARNGNLSQHYKKLIDVSSYVCEQK